MLLRFVRLYSRFSRSMTLGVRGVVLDEQNRVFLVRHSYVPGWHFPGGGVEVGETMIDSLRRELAEEGNIHLRGAPRLHGIFHNAGASRRDHVGVYVVREFDCAGPLKPTWEIREAGFFSVDALPEGTTAATQRRLAEILHDAPAAEQW